MKMIKFNAKIGGCGLLLLCAACQKERPVSSRPPIAIQSLNAAQSSEDKPLAQVGNVTILTSEIKARLQRTSPELRSQPLPAHEVREYVDNAIRFEILAQEALRRGLDRDLDVQEVARKMMVQKLIRQAIDESLKSKEIQPQEIERFYEAHLKDYQKAEEIRLAYVSGDISNGNVFDESRFYTQDELSVRLGKESAIKAFAIQNLGEEAMLEAAASHRALTVRLTGRHPQSVRTLEQVADAIRQRIYREKSNELFDGFIDQLKRDKTVRIYEENLKLVSSDQQPPSSPPQK